MKITIHKKESSHSFESDPDEPVLYAGLRQGVLLDYECATGTCGTCRAKLVEGELDQGWTDAPGRAGLKTDRGEFLMCQARALTDCDIRMPAKLVLRDDTDNFPTHLQGTINDCQKLTHDVLQFRVNLAEPVRFQAGQFVVITSPAITGARAYSMVNHEQELDSLEFVIKRFPGGKFSDWIFEQSVESQTVSLFGPLGGAVFEPELDKDILCIAGGSGIAGMMAILTHASRINYFDSHRGQIYFGVRSADDMFYVNELARFAAQNPDNLKITIALSEHKDDSDPGLEQPLLHTTGFVHLAARQSDLNPDSTMAYIAGPPPMVDGALRDLIAVSNYSPGNIRYDKFG